MSNRGASAREFEHSKEESQETKYEEQEKMKKEEKKLENVSEVGLKIGEDKITKSHKGLNINGEGLEILTTSSTGICDSKGGIACQITANSSEEGSKPAFRLKSESEATTCVERDKLDKARGLLNLEQKVQKEEEPAIGKENGCKINENKKEIEKNSEQNSNVKSESKENKKSTRKQTEETENKEGKKLSNWVAGLAPGAVRNLGNTGLKGQTLPLFLSMPGGGGGGLSLLSAGLPPGRYVILPSTTSSIPSISNISSNVSSLTLGGKPSLIAQISNKSISVVHSSSSATTTTTAVTSSAPSIIHPTTTAESTPAPTGRGYTTIGRSFRGRRKSYTTAEKLAMIEAVESGQKKSNVADQFGVAPSTLACILLQKNKIRCDQIKIDMSRRRIRRTRTMPVVPGPADKHSASAGRVDHDRGTDNPFVHFLSPLSPPRPPVFEESPEEIFSMPDLSDRMGMEGRSSPNKLEGSSNYLTCSPLISAMPGMHEDMMSGAGPSSSSQDTGESEAMQGDYDQDDVDVKSEPAFNVEPEICEDESQNNTQSSSDRRSSQSSPAPGMAGPYLLKKETHCTTILDQLLRDDTFCDVTLTAEGQSMRAHKILLCLASGYFRQVLSKEPNVQNVIVFRDIKFTELKNLINFMYTGEATVDAAELESFMKTAEMLEVTSLCDGQRKLPKNLIPKPKEAESEKAKTTFSAKRSHNSSTTSPPAKSRKIEDTLGPKTPKSVPYASTSGGATLPPHVVFHSTPVIKTEPTCEEENVAEQYHSFESLTQSPIHQQQETDSELSGDSRTNDPGPSLDKVPVGKCPFCPPSQLFKGLALTIHMSQSHPEKTVFSCEICSRVFLKKGAFEAHKDDCIR